jgi:hypothetical protein
VRRNEHHAQIGHLDPSISPGEGEARKPKSLATKRQAQHQRVNQQGEQQRKSQLPAFAACCRPSRCQRPVARGDRSSAGSDGGVHAALSMKLSSTARLDQGCPNDVPH